MDEAALSEDLVRCLRVADALAAHPMAEGFLEPVDFEVGRLWAQ